MVIGCVVSTVGLLLAGLAAQYTLSWLVPNVGIFLVSVNFRIIPQGKSVLRQSIRCFRLHASCWKCRLFFTPSMLQKLDYGLMVKILAASAVFIDIPGPMVSWIMGRD